TSLPQTTTLPPATAPLSLHDALPIFREGDENVADLRLQRRVEALGHTDCVIGQFLGGPVDDHLGRIHLAGLDHAVAAAVHVGTRSEEHTSELQSRFELVCRLLLEKTK